MAKKNIAILSLVGSILVVVGAFLPFFSVLGISGGSLFNYVTSNVKFLDKLSAILVVVGGILCLVSCFAGPAILKLAGTIAAAVGFVLLLIDMGNFSHIFNFVSTGFYVVLAGVICLVVALITKK